MASAPPAKSPPPHCRLEAGVAAALAAAAAAVATPFYAYDARVVRARAAAVRAAFPAADLYFAMKANSCPHLLREIIAAGFALECVSLGEVLLALRLGSSAILFTSSNAHDDEFFAVARLAETERPRCRVWLNCDSISRIRSVHAGAAIWIRINGPTGAGHHGHVITCGPASKFGVPHESIDDALAAARAAGARVVGLHQHIGSGVLQVETYIAAASVLTDLVVKHAAQLPDLQFVDVGGGIGVPYAPGDAAIDVGGLGIDLSARFSEVQAAFSAARAAAGAPPSPLPLTQVLEPGRFLVAESGFLVARVTALKPTPYGRTYAGVDTGFNHLVRPCMYGSYHHITHLPAAAVAAAAAGGSDPPAYIVAGNVCESGDVFTPHGPRVLGTVADPDPAAVAPLGEAAGAAAAGAAAGVGAWIARPVQPVVEGDLLVLHNAGAYGYAMASLYNLRPRPAQLLLDDPTRVERWVKGRECQPVGAAPRDDAEDAALLRSEAAIVHRGGAGATAAAPPLWVLQLTAARSAADLAAACLAGEAL